MQASVKSLLTRIARLAPEEGDAERSCCPEAAPRSCSDEPCAQSRTVRGQLAEDIHIAARIEPPEHREEEDETVAGITAAKRDITAVAQSKSVRIGLERLDRMMNAVGELVINRTRMLGRVAELERLADVLNFSKGRMADKVTEFQEKYEFSRLTSSQPSDCRPSILRSLISVAAANIPSAAATPVTPADMMPRWLSSANLRWIAMTISASSRAR